MTKQRFLHGRHYFFASFFGVFYFLKLLLAHALLLCVLRLVDEHVRPHAGHVPVLLRVWSDD